jgi:7-carboxy-7-deazaguanine synthase
MAVAHVRAEVRRLAEPFSKSRPTPDPSKEGNNPAAHDVQFPSSGGVRGGFSRLPLVEFTGGEPLLQTNALPLMKQLCDDGFTVLVETSGALDISQTDPRVRHIMDLKCPGSGEVARNRWENLPHLKATDEIKFVIGTVEDYEWAKQQIIAHKLDAVCPLLMSWVHPLAPGQQDMSLKRVPPGQTPISRRDLVERIIGDALPVRFQVQLHKLIWPPEQRGV